MLEDSPDNQYLIQEMLSKTGLRLTIASNGAEGLKLGLERRFDVILMDIQMPIMDGSAKSNDAWLIFPQGKDLPWARAMLVATN